MAKFLEPGRRGPGPKTLPKPAKTDVMGPEIDPKTVPKSSKTDFIDAGQFFAANRKPTWGYVGAKLEPTCDQNRYLTSLKFRLRFRRVLEASRARFW